MQIIIAHVASIGQRLRRVESGYRRRTQKHLSSSPTASLEMMALASYVLPATSVYCDAFAEVDKTIPRITRCRKTRLAMLTSTQLKRFANSTMKLMSLLIFRPKAACNCRCGYHRWFYPLVFGQALWKLTLQ